MSTNSPLLSAKGSGSIGDLPVQEHLSKEIRYLYPSSRILLQEISWDRYEALRNNSLNSAISMTYEEGDLELMTPSRSHADISVRLNLIVITLASALGLPCKMLGRTTWRKPELRMAKETDGCFYFGNLARIPRDDIDLRVDPPPDLAIEVEIAQNKLDPMNAYSSIGVPEVWLCTGLDLKFLRLQNNQIYAESTHSLAFPFLQPKDLMPRLDQVGRSDDLPDWGGMILEWARLEMVPASATFAPSRRASSPPIEDRPR